MKTNKDTALPRFLGIDYGERNIGLALGYNGLVMPLRTVSNKTERDALFEINKVIVENKVGNIVIGIPLTADNKETKESAIVRRFANNLKTITKRPVIFQNEFGTSKKSLEEAISLDVPQKRRHTNDHLAATLILKTFFEENNLGTQDK
jgi:putative Holliday junction resolvase